VGFVKIGSVTVSLSFAKIGCDTVIFVKIGFCDSADFVKIGCVSVSVRYVKIGSVTVALY
jgi:hypothetical protein